LPSDFHFSHRGSPIPDGRGAFEESVLSFLFFVTAKTSLAGSTGFLFFVGHPAYKNAAKKMAKIFCRLGARKQSVSNSPKNAKSLGENRPDHPVSAARFGHSEEGIHLPQIFKEK
jgi:hypothetical protein